MIDGLSNDPRKPAETGKLLKRSQKSMEYEMMEKLDDVKDMIDRHTRAIQSSVTANAQKTIDFVRKLHKKRNAPVDTVKSAEEKIHKNANVRLNEALTSLVQLWNNLRQTKSGPEIEFELAEPKKPANKSEKTIRTGNASESSSSADTSKEDADERPKVSFRS